MDRFRFGASAGSLGRRLKLVGRIIAATEQFDAYLGVADPTVGLHIHLPLRRSSS